MEEEHKQDEPSAALRSPEPAAPPSSEASHGPDAAPPVAQTTGDEALAQAMAAEAQQDEPGATAKGDAGAEPDLRMPEGPVQVQPAEFGTLTSEQRADNRAANIDLLLDVSLPVAIELGRTQMTISDILELGSGSIVELDKLAGEPVDILVNSKPLAKGEVVVLDENFGVRITSLVSPRERLERLNLQ
jgi:flagellar motor switch protein FliN/FliY